MDCSLKGVHIGQLDFFNCNDMLDFIFQQSFKEITRLKAKVNLANQFSNRERKEKIQFKVA
jgi:hypothetical protein